MSDFYNPDYPTSNAGGFSQHLYHPENNNSMFYYGGATGYSSFNMPSPFGNVQPDSRRNDGLNAQVMPQVPQMPTYPQGNNGVMPFSSYPQNPNEPNQQMGFNSLVESRRYDNQPVNVGNNPWANPQPIAQMPNPIVSQPATPSPWSYPTTAPSYYNDPSCAALYMNQKIGFDRSVSAWDNAYTMPRQIVPPNINWNQANQNQFQYVPSQPVYPAFSGQQTPMSWKDMADRNWGGSGI